MELPFRLHLPDRRRSAGFILAIAVEATLIILLLVFGPHATPAPKTASMPTITIVPPPPDDPQSIAPDRSKKADDTPVPKSASAPPSPLPPDVAPPPKQPPPPVPLPGVLPIELGASNIGKIKGSGDGDSAGAGPDSKLAYGPGVGPGGMPLYRAEWYREPTDAQLSGYLNGPPPPNSWAYIACRTIADYHVDNCRMIGESPAGSGLARQMRLAAWQFLVRPPRRGGKALVGSWVGIRIEFTTIEQKAQRRPKPTYAPSGDDALNQ